MLRGLPRRGNCARRRRRSQITAMLNGPKSHVAQLETWWQNFCAVTELPVVLDLDFRWKSNILLARDVIGNFLQFVRENQRHHVKERGCGHHETPQRYCAPVLSDHDDSDRPQQPAAASRVQNLYYKQDIESPLE